MAAIVQSAPITTNPASSSKPTPPAYYYNVKMTCGGCSGAITRVLAKLITPPNAYTVSLEKQQVLVWGPTIPPFETVTEKIAKTGKEILAKEVINDEAVLAKIVNAA